MSTTSRGTDFKRLPTSLFCLLIVINYAKATIDYTAFRKDTIFQETKRESARTTRTILEESLQRNITSGDNLQHGTEHLLQYGALLRTQILDTFGKLVYDHYDDFGMSQIEALYRVYRETLERKYNIFDIVPSVLKDPDTRPTKICAYINDHVKTCLKESSKICMHIKIHDEPHEDTLSKPALNVTREIYELAEIPRYYSRGFSPAAVLEYLRSGRLRFTPALFSGLLHNVQYDSFDDKVRTAERELVLFLTRGSGKFTDETEKVSTSARSVSELLKNYLAGGEKIFTGKALRHAIYLAEHVIREVDAISENIEWLGTVYDNSTINLKYLFELILSNDTMDKDVLDARNYLLQQIKDNKIVERYLRIEKYQQAGPDQLLMEIFGQLRDIHYAEDLVTSLYTHARFWHKSHMIENLEELLELFDAYENLRGIPQYRKLLQNADRIKSDLRHSKNVSIELLCSRPRTCLRIGLDMVRNCAVIDEKTKIAIDAFTNPSCQCSCLEDDSAISITNTTKVGGEINESIEKSFISATTENPDDIVETQNNTTTESPMANMNADLGDEDDSKKERIDSAEMISEPSTVKPCVGDCSSDCNGPDCQSQENCTGSGCIEKPQGKGCKGSQCEIEKTTNKSITIECEGPDCEKIQCEGSKCTETSCEEANCTSNLDEVHDSRFSSCEGDDCDASSADRSSCEGPDCSDASSEGDDSEVNVTERSDCEGPDCSDASSEGDDSASNSAERSDCEGPDCSDVSCEGDDCRYNSTERSDCEGPDCSNSGCEGDDCQDKNTPSSVCEGLDCEDDAQLNGTGSTEKLPCVGANCPPVSCVGNDCKDNDTEISCEGPNCPNISCEGGDCTKDLDASSTCEDSDCEVKSQLGGTGSGSSCEGPNCSAEKSAQHCEGPDCSTEPEDECDDCSKETIEDECQTPDCKNASITAKPKVIGCQGNNCTDKDCEGSDCPGKSKDECEGPNCSNSNCTGPNCFNTNCTGPNCTDDVMTECEGPVCFNNNCTGTNCAANGTKTECKGSDCPKMNCTGPDCLEKETTCEGPDCLRNGTTCEGPDCRGHAPEAACTGLNCSVDTRNDTCFGPNCPVKPPSQNECTDSDCSSTSLDDNESCIGPDCTGSHAASEEESDCEGGDCDRISEENLSSGSDSTEDRNGEKCEGEDCKNVVEKPCEGPDCSAEFTPQPKDETTKQPCISDNCTIVSPKIEGKCEGANCTDNSGKDELNSIEDEKNCKGGECETNGKKTCEGDECVDEVPGEGDEQITEQPCIGDNCTIVNPTTEGKCEGANCTDNSRKDELNSIEEEKDCKGGECETNGEKPCDGGECETNGEKPCEGGECETNGEKPCEGEECETNGKKSCEGDECVDEVPGEGDEQITEEPCIGDNCTIVNPTTEDKCEGANCTDNSRKYELNSIEDEKDCKGGECETNGEKPCEGGECETNGKKSCEGDECVEEIPGEGDEQITEEPCIGDNCTIVNPTTEGDCEEANCTDSSKKDVLNSIEVEKDCKGGECETNGKKTCEGDECEPNGKKSCEGDECVDEVPGEEDELITKESCIDDGCTTVSPTTESNCEGTNCTGSSTKIIENEGDCTGEGCEGIGKSHCKGNECIDELPEGEDETITEEPCSDGNCTSSLVPPNKEIQPTTEPSVESGSTRTPAVPGVSTFCGNSDPHYRRQLNRLRNMRRIDASNSSPNYQSWNNVILPYVTEKISKNENAKDREKKSRKEVKNVNVKMNDSDALKAEEIGEGMNSQEIIEKDEIKLKNQRLNAIERADSKKKTTLDTSGELEPEEDGIESEMKKNDQQRLKLSSSKKATTKKVTMTDEQGEDNNEEIEKEIKTKSKKVEKSARKNYRKSIGNGKLSEKERKEIFRTRIHNLGKKVFRNHRRNSTKSNREEDENEGTEEEIQTKSKKLEKSAGKNYEEGVGNGKIREKERKEIFRTRLHNLRNKAIRNHSENSTKSKNEENDNEGIEEEIETESKKLEKSAVRNYDEGVGNDKLSEKQRKEIFGSKLHNLVNKVIKNQRRSAAKSNHKEDSYETASGEQINDDEEFEEEVHTNSQELHKGWKTIHRGSSAKSSVTMTNEEKAKGKKLKNKTKTKTDKIHIVLNGKHAGKEIHKNGSAVGGEKETEEDIQDDLKNLQNRWKILKRGSTRRSSVKNTMDEGAKEKKELDIKTKSKLQKGWKEFQRKHSTKAKDLPDENDSQSDEDASPEEIISHRGVVKSRSKRTRNSRKRPTEWLEKRRVRTKLRSRGGHAWVEKSSRMKVLRTHRAKPTGLRASRKSELLKRVIKLQNDKEAIGASEQLPLVYQADTRNTEPWILKRKFTSKRRKNVTPQNMKTHRLREVDADLKRSAPVTS